MLYILSGQDDFSLNQSLEKIKSDVGDPESLAANVTILEGSEVTINQLRGFCEAVPFLAEKRLVIVNGLLIRFQPTDRLRRQGRSRKSNTQPEDYKALADYISTIPDSTILVLVEDEVRITNPFFKALSGKARVQSFPLLREAGLKHWVHNRVKEEGGNITPGAVDLLIKLVGSNLWIMSSEISKLILYTAGRRISEDEIELMVGYTQQTNVFTVVDAIIESKTRTASRLVQYLMNEGVSPSYLLAMLTRQLRLIVRTKDVQTVRMSPNELRSRLGLESEFVARKTLEQARQYSLPRLKHVYLQLLETDLAIKTSKYEPELALNILVAELCQPRPVT